ncbi:MAG: DNA recombination protein RmuC [Proteobacteria bacterium]|nr:DNA recombination protein RmuC [Pseudomonadota bacterium]
MDPLILGLAAALVIAVILGVLRVRGLGQELAAVQAELAAERDRNRAANDAVNDHLRRTTEAETRLALAESQLTDSMMRQTQQAAELEAAKQSRAAAEQATALARQQTEAMRASMTDWEKTKEEALAAARSAMLKTAADMSSKLLEDHKRESKTAKEDGEKRVGEATKHLLTQFETLSKTVSSLHDQVGQSRDTVNVIERALSNPSSAGYAAETVLENTLKSFGLTPGRDYVLQYTVDSGEGGRLRPDALVFLPGDTVLVVDSKASKHLLELARAEDEVSEAAANARLATSMNQHLRDLAGRQYRAAIQADYKAAGHGREARQLISIMWLPNDGAVEKVQRADPDFQRKASQQNIYVAGPNSLWTAMGVAGLHINLGRQAENRDRIVETVHELIESVTVMLNHVGGVGRGLKSAATAYGKLSGSINSRVLPRARKLIEQGIEAPSKGMPKALPGFQVVETDAPDAIDTDSNDVESPRELPPPAAD